MSMVIGQTGMARFNAPREYRRVLYGGEIYVPTVPIQDTPSHRLRSVRCEFDRIGTRYGSSLLLGFMVVGWCLCVYVCLSGVVGLCCMPVYVCMVR